MDNGNRAHAETTPSVLTLPGPAADLWRQVRATVRHELEAITSAEAPYAIGGGSVLAARWRHRHSHDIDLLTHPGTPLALLAERNNPECRFEEKMRELGGTPRFNSDLNFWVVVFDGGDRKLDIWGRSPLLNAGQKACTIDGRAETALSTAQILRGKLERADDHLPRDAYDLAKALEKDPRGLEAAVNAISRELAAQTAQAFHWAAPAIADEAHEALSGIPNSERIDPRQLGSRAGNAIASAMYTTCRVETRNGAIEVTTATRTRRQEKDRIETDDAQEHFERAGLNAHLHGKGPGGEALLSYALSCCAAREDRLVFEETEGVVRAWRTKTRAMNRPTDAAHSGEVERRVR